jgi:septal ring factor EnvC (AmiA/AmiB activator)
VSARVDEQSLIARAFSWAWALVAALLAVVWKSLNDRINGKASKDSVASALEAMSRHTDEDREVHEKILAKLDDTNASIGRTNERLGEVIGELRAIKTRSPWG